MSKPLLTTPQLLSAMRPSSFISRNTSSCCSFSRLHASSPRSTALSSSASTPRHLSSLSSIQCHGSSRLRATRTTSGAWGERVRPYKTVHEQRSRYRSGPFSWKAGVLFLASGAGLIFYFRYEKERMERERVAEAAKGVGRPKVGGPFKLTDQNGQEFTDQDMLGRHSLIYFGFSHCPDICPEELDKMARMIDLLRADPSLRDTPALLPVFITCDPARDTPAVLKEYLSEFHAGLIGLTGSWEDIKGVCKKYRVYFSTPEGVKPGQDYLVDHSIYFYLMDPEGDFVEAIGRQHSPEQAAQIIRAHVTDWKSKR